ncbi:histidine phosphatase family protein [Mycobacterium sp. ITM-2016-00318]|uniref:histidine phosphatase family protein n=1 Tax=Mycobacterium sp. ITM-2016-00318 TaxID=2099693 RepID=UPI00130485BB|nr:histidine phosphatase family protein [Mycobacterium sp. ITM-2016-00318]WNG92390.1 histidine phosphatase family protein [Mycobacterium sp. ITM-2016-00318]
MHKSSSRRVLGVIGAAFTAVISFILAVIPAGAMTVTFVRHAESQANADGIIDTKVPGPGLTELGWSQARTVAGQLPAHPSGIYASTMIRTQQTATPYAARIEYGADSAENEAKVAVGTVPGSDVRVLDGLQEISAGILEGSSEDEGIGRLGYALAPIAWSLGLRFVRIPGSEDGNEFDARVDAALKQMETDGSETPVVFSHGATIMFWTMMNVDNPDPLLLLTHQLDNTETVVVEKNDDGSWTLKSWGGEEVGSANLPTQLFVNTRDLIVAPQTALYNFSRDVGVETGVEGVEDVAKATAKFGTDTVIDIGNAVQGLGAAETNSSAAALTANAGSTTNRTAGNKVTPGGRITGGLSRNNERVREAVQDVRNDIATSIKKVGDTAKKVADGANDAA